MTAHSLSRWSQRIMMIITAGILLAVIAGAIAIAINSRSQPASSGLGTTEAVPVPPIPISLPLDGRGPEYPAESAPLPLVHTPNGHVFEPASCRECNLFGFITSGDDLAGRTSQFANLDTAGQTVYVHPSPYVVSGPEGDQPTRSYGQDDGGTYTMYSWYFQVGVRVVSAGFEVNVGDKRLARVAHVAPAPEGSPPGAATCVWFKIYPEDEALADAWFAAVAGNAPVPVVN